MSASATTRIGRPGDLARASEAREGVLLGEPVPRHQQALRPLDDLAGCERLGERLGLLPERLRAPRDAPARRAMAGRRSVSRNGLTR